MQETIYMKGQSLISGKVMKLFQNMVCWNFYPASYAFSEDHQMRTGPTPESYLSQFMYLYDTCPFVKLKGK